MSDLSKSQDVPQEAPKIEFPCDYPVKVVGKAGDELHTLVIAVMETHAPGFDQARITVRDSRKGNFQAITITITATGESQLQALFDDLKVSPLVHMVL
jgi:putative lipoic acid-binding regulatory protein